MIVNGLPKEPSLTEAQKYITNFRTDENLLVEGGPGTGKSVAAVYRVKHIIKTNGNSKKVLFLVYNKPLKQYLTDQLKANDLSYVIANTYHSWMYWFYKDRFNRKPPSKAMFSYDWDSISKELASMTDVYDYVVVDEAQDFPIELLEILTRLGKYITCFIDPDQAIEENKTSVEDLIDVLDVDNATPLTQNFRNTAAIQALASTFGNPSISYRCNKAGIKPVAYECQDYNSQINKIIEIVNLNPSARIGIVVGHKEQQDLYDLLSKKLKNRFIQLYTNKQVLSTSGNLHETKDGLSFNEKGVTILSYNTTKGLEFDVVILPNFTSIWKKDHITDMNKIYVAMTRARQRLYLTYIDKYQYKSIDTLKVLKSNSNLVDWK